MIGRLFSIMIIGVLLFTVDGLGQNTWVKTFGGSGDEIGYSIVPTTDGGYILTGGTRTNDGEFGGWTENTSDIFVMKLNSNGETVWKKTFGGSGGDWGSSITNTNDSGYVLTGYTRSNDGDFSGMNKSVIIINEHEIWVEYDIFVMKLNSNGDTVWKKTYGGNSYDLGYSITTTSDGGYVLTGNTESNDGDFSGMNKGYDDIFVMKLNSSGDIVWKKTFGGDGVDYGTSITRTRDGGYVLTGGTFSNNGDFSGMNKGKGDIIVIKLNSSGDIVWKKTFGGSNDEGENRFDEERGTSILTTDDGRYILTGSTSSNNGDFSGLKKKGGEDIFVIKINNNGKIVWKKKFGGTSDEKGNSITTTNDSGFVLTGYTYSDDGDFRGMKKEHSGYTDIIILKLNSIGDIVWKKSIGGTYQDKGNSITTTNDSGYVLTGYTRSNDVDFLELKKEHGDFFFIKLDKNGNLEKK